MLSTSALIKENRENCKFKVIPKYTERLRPGCTPQDPVSKNEVNTFKNTEKVLECYCLLVYVLVGVGALCGAGGKKQSCLFSFFGLFFSGRMSQCSPGCP